MLPDFPDLKRLVLENAYATMRKLVAERNPILADIKTYTQHEGRSMRYEQVGYGEKQEALQEHSIPIQITFEEVPTLMGDKLLAKMQELADAVGERQIKSLLAKHDEATQMTGNRIDAMGRPLDGPMLLELMRTMPVDFDADGNILPTTKFLTHPSMMPTYKAAIEEIENDPELQSRHRKSIAEQHNEWVDRENRRKLAD
jgi:hypothetical protein